MGTGERIALVKFAQS